MGLVGLLVLPVLLALLASELLLQEALAHLDCHFVCHSDVELMIRKNAIPMWCAVNRKVLKI